MNKVYIDYCPGSHGSFLEYICNQTMSPNFDNFKPPFESNGSSHKLSPEYLASRDFISSHTLSDMSYVDNLLDDTNVIRILFQKDDVLELASYLYTRGYDKIDNIHDLNAWCNSENHLIKHLKQDHHLDVITPARLRENFKDNFKVFTDDNFFMDGEASEIETRTNRFNNFTIMFSDLNHPGRILYKLHEIAKFVKMPIKITDITYQLLNQFIHLNNHRYDYRDALNLVDGILNGGTAPFPQLTVLQEGFIDARLEECYNIKMPTDRTTYFRTMPEIRNYINEC